MAEESRAGLMQSIMRAKVEQVGSQTEAIDFRRVLLGRNGFVENGPLSAARCLVGVR